MTNTDIPIVFTATDVLNATGITYRQFDHWCRHGWLKPFNEGGGNGSRRLFTEDEYDTACRMGRLVQAGIQPEVAHAVARGDTQARDRLVRALSTTSLGGAVMATRWQEAAACRGSDPHLFDPLSDKERRKHGGNPLGHARIQEAIAVCVGCPVRRACGATAVAGKFVGVWGARYRNQATSLSRRDGKKTAA